MCYSPKCMRLGFSPEGNPESPFFTLTRHKYDDGAIDVTVPTGFSTDLTSGIKCIGQILLLAAPFAAYYTPLLWVLFGVAVVTIIIRDPLGRHQRAALFHDYCYRNQESVDNDRFTADAIYRIMLKRDNVSALRSNISYLGLRLFGWIAWNKNKK